jgi:hypothetical protein
MTFKRWLPTFLAFPVGGFLAIETVGSLDGVASGAAGGLIAGAIIGAGQWLALRSGRVGRRWVAHTAVAMSAGTALATVVTGAGTEVADLMVTGLVAGAAVGAAQSPLLGAGRLVAAAWTGVTAGSWALGWLTSSFIGLDVERGYHVFGSSGAVVVTVLTGLALRRILAARSGARLTLRSPAALGA